MPAPATLPADRPGSDPVPRLALSMTEAAAAIGVSRQHLYSIVNRGELLTRKVGNRRVITVSELDRYLNSAATAAGL